MKYIQFVKLHQKTIFFILLFAPDNQKTIEKMKNDSNEARYSPESDREGFSFSRSSAWAELRDPSGPPEELRRNRRGTAEETRSIRRIENLKTH